MRFVTIPSTLIERAKPSGTSEYLEEKDTSSIEVLRILGRFLMLAREFPVPALLGVMFLTLSSMCVIMGPRVIAWIIDDALVNRDVASLYYYCGMLVAIEIGQFIGFAGQSFFFTVLGQQLMQLMRVRLFSHFLQLPLPTIDRIPRGALVTRLTTDVAYLSEMFQTGFVQTLKDVVLITVAIIGMLTLDVQLTLVALLGFPLLFLFAARITPRLFFAHREVRRMMTALNALLVDTFGNKKVVSSFNLNGLFRDRTVWVSEAIGDGHLLRLRTNALFHPFTTIITAFSVVSLFMLGALKIEEGTAQVGTLVAFLSYLLMIFWPIVHTVNRIDVVLSGVASLERIFESLSWELEEEDTLTSEWKEFQFEGEIIFEGVWFAYQGEDWVLKDLSFELKKGEHLGIVGPTGSGKSTMMNLLLRFYEPQRGRILLDGHDIRSIPRQLLREKIGIVHQQAYIFPGTLRENITLWQETEEAWLQEIFEHEAFSILTEKEDAFEGSAEELSAGMRQVLSFARNLYRRPSVWILDEATAHLDPTLDDQLNDLLQTFGAGTTACIIAHRLSSVKHCDAIMVLKEGRKVEFGPHEELLSTDGEYASMYRIQQRSLG